MNLQTRKFEITVLASIAAALVTGCGGSDSPSSATAKPAAAPYAAAVGCDSLKSLKLTGATIVSADTIPAGSFTPPGSTTAFDNLPEFCRVVATATPATGSSIGIELWLPSKSWNGRYQQVGTHGTGGVLYWSEMAPQLRRGFATGATDTGHTLPAPVSGQPLLANRGSVWAIGFPERVKDYGYRAVHELVDKAKQTILAYYGRKQDYAYFNGCSKGGQDGVKNAQVYPADFNGIIAGGAAAQATRAATAQLVQDIRLRDAGIQGAAGTAILQLAQKSAIEACDALDGVKDGYIANPSRCKWDPATLVCKPGQDPSTCITAPQAAALAANYAPIVDPVTGQQVFHGLSRGGEHDQIRFGHQNNLSSYSLSLYQIALEDPNWDGSTFDLHRDFAVLQAKLADSIDAVDPNLSPFKTAGGKLLQLQTWDDSAFMPLWAPEYYDQVTARLGGAEATGEFYRLFMMPAQGHCAGNGVGPSNVGQENFLAVSSDADHDVVTAMQDWVEKGIAPRRLVATRFKGADISSGIDLQRPLCPYPLEAVYKGSGDTTQAENFTCSAALGTGN
ncbi:tannase/feruloyl esterase family alpha/beta hydrolase [Pelomonas sp. KK5]|uniref:tannase/feruloyl esterase family alpha/beta hydrolase n=1 Tax=Pelomonas sp. KK5 TaxID=1855730 RepID=UPI001301C195|nr:tannase/feruloyl esterase family alpha/beta hydrolase [Pelomonas sp. KK5]